MAKRAVVTRAQLDTLADRAKAARRNAYAPYSHFKVGAAVQTAGGRVFDGCNVENASYGLCICAERTAIAKAISEGEKRIVAMAVATRGRTPGPPCGMCRQVLSEFADPSTPVLLVAESGPTRKVTLGDLLPLPFGKTFL